MDEQNVIWPYSGILAIKECTCYNMDELDNTMQSEKCHKRPYTIWSHSYESPG